MIVQYPKCAHGHGLKYRNRTNRPMWSNGHPTAAENKSLHLLKGVGWGYKTKRDTCNAMIQNITGYSFTVF